jgi:hypothetical protein
MADGETVVDVSVPLSKDELFADDIRNRLGGLYSRNAD